VQQLGVKGAWVDVNVHSFLHSLFPSFIHSFISYSVPKEVLRLSQACFPITVTTAASFNLQYPLVSFRSSCRCLCLLRRPPLNYNLPFFFHAIWCSIRRFLSQMWPIKLHVLLFIVRKLLIFFLLIYNTFPFAKKKIEQNKLLRPPPAPQFNALQLFMICYLKCAMFSIININWCKFSKLTFSSK